MRLLASLVLWSVIVPLGPQVPAGVHRSGPLRAPRTFATALPLRGSLPVRCPADAPSVGLFGEEEDSSDGDAFGCLASETLPALVVCGPFRPAAGWRYGVVGAALRPIHLRC